MENHPPRKPIPLGYKELMAGSSVHRDLSAHLWYVVKQGFLKSKRIEGNFPLKVSFARVVSTVPATADKSAGL